MASNYRVGCPLGTLLLAAVGLLHLSAASPCGGRGGADVCPVDEATSLLQGLTGQLATRGGSGEPGYGAAPLDDMQRRLGTTKEQRRSFVERFLTHVLAAPPKSITVASAELASVVAAALPPLAAEHLWDQVSLQELHLAFLQAGAEMSRGQRTLDELGERSATIHAEHLQCRVWESGKCEKRGKCESEFETLAALAGSYEETTDSRKEFAQVARDGKADECMLFHTGCREQRELCKLTQKSLEVASCASGLQVDRMRLQYTENSTQAASALEEASSDIQVEEANRKAELSNLQELQCIQNHFAAGSYDIGDCRPMRHNVSSLDIFYAEMPDQVELPPVIARPCTEEYVSTAYGNLPSFAPAADCTPCGDLEADVTKFEAEVKSALAHKAPATYAGPHFKRKVVLEEFRTESSKEFWNGYATGYESGVKVIQDEIEQGMASQDFRDAADSFQAGVSRASDASFEKAMARPGARPDGPNEDGPLEKAKARPGAEDGSNEDGPREDLAKGFAKGFQRGFAFINEGVQKSLQRAPGRDRPAAFGDHAEMITRALMLDFEGNYERGVEGAFMAAGASSGKDLRIAFWKDFERSFGSTLNRAWDHDHSGK